MLSSARFILRSSSHKAPNPLKEITDKLDLFLLKQDYLTVRNGLMREKKTEKDCEYLSKILTKLEDTHEKLLKDSKS